jgi:hypothetical protein
MAARDSDYEDNMPIVDLFSKRKKRLEKGAVPDVYQYDELPKPLRVQISLIWDASIGPYGEDRFGYDLPTNRFWRFVHGSMCKEKGVYALSDRSMNEQVQCHEYLLNAGTDDALDIIELSFQVIDRLVPQMTYEELGRVKPSQKPDDAINELNYRFREHGVGYQYVDGMIVRVDSQLIHAEVVKPALSLLSGPGFEGPEEEFIRAFDHYRHGDYKEAVAEALKAFESAMKAICKIHKWPHDPNATAKPLLDVLFARGLVQPELQTHFAGLRSALESGLPTLSNRTSRHGQGPEPKPIPPYFAGHALHLVAANIVFLVEAHKALR